MNEKTPDGLDPAKPDRKAGFDHLIAASAYSRQGLRRLWRESAFRQECLLAVIIFAVFAAVGAPILAYLGMLVLTGIVFALEALNTAIETLVDHISPEWSVMARNAKDLGSAAVAIMVAVQSLYAIVVVLAVLAG